MNPGAFASRAWRILYRRFLSPAIHLLSGGGAGCRFEPTCGDYTEQALQEWGLLRGLGLGIRRVLRCHPGSQGGWDPVPKR